MSLYPGRRFVGDTVLLAVNVQNESGTDIDPGTDVILRVRNPRGQTNTYKYTESAVQREDTGDYYYEYVPAYAGRHHYEWSITGTDTARLEQSSFIVQADPWNMGVSSSDYGNWT